MDVHFIDTREGTIQFALLWMKRDEMLQDLQQFLDEDASLAGFGEQTVVHKRASNT
jgi:hypothetical protein